MEWKMQMSCWLSLKVIRNNTVRATNANSKTRFNLLSFFLITYTSKPQMKMKIIRYEVYTPTYPMKELSEAETIIISYNHVQNNEKFAPSQPPAKSCLYINAWELIIKLNNI